MATKKLLNGMTPSAAPGSDEEPEVGDAETPPLKKKKKKQQNPDDLSVEIAVPMG